MVKSGLLWRTNSFECRVSKKLKHFGAYCFGFITLVLMLSLAGFDAPVLRLLKVKVLSSSLEVSSRFLRTIAAWPSTIVLPGPSASPV